MRSGVNGAEEPIVGHSADLVTAGFERPLRLQRMAQAVLEQLAAALPASADRIGLYALVPEVMRGMHAEADDDEPAGPSEQERAHQCLRQAMAAARWPVGPEQVLCSASGARSEALRLIGVASSALAQGLIDRAVVLAVDTLLDDATLAELDRSGRLKCEASPAGLQPGEGGVALMLTGHTTPTPGEHTRVIAVALDDEEPAEGEAPPPSGQALARAVELAAQGRHGTHAWVLSDHNGEHRRAHDWGSAWARLRGNDDAFAQADVWYPALAFGDTGAAGALAALAMVWAAQERGYAPATTAVVVCADDGPRRAALLLQRS